MMTAVESWLALDVGGANLKAAHSSGVVRSVPFDLWRTPAELPAMVAQLVASLPASERVALTMTAELCDCYPTKRHGVHAVLDAVAAVTAEESLFVWGLDGRLHSRNEIRERPLLVAAANWLALATFAATLTGTRPGLLIDVGSTTTDLIALAGGAPVATGKTDTERLQTGELVYAGVRRTPVCALADRLPFRGRATGLAAELFATTLDIFLVLGDIPDAPGDSATADGRPATVEAARARLARMVGADRDGFSHDDALRFAGSARETLLARLVGAVEQRGAPRPDCVVVSGSGEFLARSLAERVVGPGGTIVSLCELWGHEASSAACARALLEIAVGLSRS